MHAAEGLCAPQSNHAVTWQYPEPLGTDRAQSQSIWLVRGRVRLLAGWGSPILNKQTTCITKLLASGRTDVFWGRQFLSEFRPGFRVGLNTLPRTSATHCKRQHTANTLPKSAYCNCNWSAR